MEVQYHVVQNVLSTAAQKYTLCHIVGTADQSSGVCVLYGDTSYVELAVSVA
jgi:hypothetical protein